MNATDPHIDAEVLAQFAEGKLKRAELPAVLAHVDRCAACLQTLRDANEALAERKVSGGIHVRWLAAAAIIAVAILAIPFVRRAAFPSAMSRLIALSPRSARITEVRLTGGFAWAPYRGAMRANGSSPQAERLKLEGAAGDAVERADHDSSAEAQRVAGVGLVLIAQPFDAVTRLEAATSRAPNDARAWSDLAAAQYASAVRLDRPSLLPAALASADRALRIDPQLAEALFNRALILERLGLRQQAYDAWQRYLRSDATSDWAREAREHAARLAPTTGEQLFKQQMPRLERAAANGDQTVMLAVVDRYREQSRAFAEAEYLGRWSEAVRRGDASDAARQLGVARRIGDALAQLSGESLLHDAVSAIDAAPSADLAMIAQAHDLYRRGRIAYSRHELLAAEPDLRQAATLFASARDPMAIMARYYAAQVRFDRNDVTGARAELANLLETLQARPRFAASRALVEWELAICASVDDDWVHSLPLLQDAESIFRRIGERSNLGFVETLLGDNLICLDRTDEAWAARIRSFELLSDEGRGDRLPVALGGAARMELRAGRLDSARAMLQLEDAADRGAGSDVLLSNALVREAALSAALGDDDTAVRQARDASAIARRIADGSLRNRASVDAAFAAGAAMLHGDPNHARADLTRAIDGYRSLEMTFFLPEPLLLRARAALRTGLRDDAARDLEDGISIVEGHRIPFAAGVVGTGAFDAGAELFHDAIALSLDRGDAAKAFRYAERSRAHSGASPAIGVAELQQRLRGSDTAVLELVVVPPDVISFAITANDFVASRHSFGAETTSDGALYEALIRPSAQVLSRAHHLIVVPDPQLEDLPFAALLDVDRGRRLVETFTVATASSATALVPEGGAHTRESLLAVKLPSGERAASVALPDSVQEIADVSPLYRRSTTIAGDRATLAAFAAAAPHADVIHIAGHTERQQGDGDETLLFAEEHVSWRDLASIPLSRGAVVVLAACETLRVRRGRSTALSLADGVIAAGAGDVVGTLTPVADSDAREWFRAIHEQLAAGASAADAVRQVQLHYAAWRSIALRTTRIATTG